MKRSNRVLAMVFAFGFGSVHAVNLNPDGVGGHPVIPTKRVIDQPNAVLDALKRNDFAALIEASERDSDIAAIAKQWDEKVARHREDRAKRAAAESEVPEAFNAFDDGMQQTWQKLQSAEGVDALVDELQPKVAEAVSENLLQFNLGFGAAFTALASEKDLSALEVQQLTQLMYAVQNWTGRVDFADRERLRAALNAVSRLVRQTKLKRFEDTEVLPFEDAIVHGDAMIATVKQVFAAYEVDVDQILKSVRFSEIDALFDMATLHVEARVFGVDLSHDFKMQWYEGEWAGVDYVEMRKQLKVDAAEEAVSAAAEAAAAAAKAAQGSAAKPSSGGCSADAEFDFGADAEAPAK